MARRAEKYPGEPHEAVRYWLAEIGAARKREKSYRDTGKKVRDIYAGEKADSVPFNILFSNTEIIFPSLYSQTPRPVVQRRYKDDDVLGKAAAVAGQRLLEFLVDTNIDEYDTFNDAMKAATMDGLLPGRGFTAIKYDADTSGDAVASELVCPEIKSWDRTYFGYAKKWSRVPWVAHELFVDRKEAERLFGEKIAGEIEYTTGENDDEDERDDTEEKGERKTACVYQIWDKNGGRKIRWVSAHYIDDYLKVEDDPLRLTGFFNMPRPLQFIEKTDDLCPTAPYELYKNQAEELNSLTRRIARLVKAMKARGIYDTNLGENLSRLMEADDNEMVPADSASALSTEKGMANAIWFWPLDVLERALAQLIAAREQCKMVIYEIMGISDILRGSSKASETLGAQQIKSQWGSLRLKSKQAEVQRYARDMLRMMLEVAALRFSEETWSRMTGLPFLTEQQFEQAALVAQQMAAAGDPSALQQLQQQVKWADVLEVLKDDLQRAYRIDIETNSTLEPEAAEDQKNISELMTAIGQFLNGVGPLVAQGMLPFETAQTMLLAITRRFRFGTEIEDQIKQMQAPKPEDNGAAQAKQEVKAAQEKLASDQASMQDKAIIMQLQTEIARMRQEQQLHTKEQALRDKETDLEVREIALKTEQNVFAMEKKAQSDSLTQRAAGESQKLDHKKAIVGMEQKMAKTDQVVSKQLDSKLATTIDKLGAMIGQLVESVTEQSRGNQELVTALKAPRKRTAVRDKDGNLQGSVDEIAA